MMAKASTRTEECSPGDARTRLGHARLYLEVAETVLSEETGDEATVATGNAVLAAIAAADAICCAASGRRCRGQDHRDAVAYLEKVTGDLSLASLLRDVIALKDAGHYGLGNVVVSRAKSAVRKASQLVAEAERRVR
jgi:hypothetical protein